MELIGIDIKSWWWAYLTGYCFSIIGNFIFVRSIISKMWEELKLSHKLTRSHAWHSSAVGFLEAVLYTSSWLAGYPHFIAVWLALKVAGQWGRWEQERFIYNVFLIGSGLSIFYGVIGALIVIWLKKQMYAEVIWIPTVLVVISIIFLINVCHYVKQARNEEEAKKEG